MKKKLIVEKLWNSLVFEKYQNRVKIDELEIEKTSNYFLIIKKKDMSLIYQRLYMILVLILMK